MKKLFALIPLICLSAWAADPEFALVIKDHRFEPAELRVPVGQKVKLVVHNQDASPKSSKATSSTARRSSLPAARPISSSAR